MTDLVPAPETAPAEPQNRASGGEILLRCVVVLLGIFLGFIAALFISFGTGWLEIC